MKMFIAGVAEIHANMANTAWLNSSRDRRYLIGTLVLILLAGMINFEVRDRQWENWKLQPERHFIGTSPMLASNDAGYFLSNARDYLAGAPLGAFEQTRLYPDQNEYHRLATDPGFEPVEDRWVTAKDIPLLSFILAHFASMFTNGDLLLAGNLMIPISAALTAVAIGCMFWIAGYPAEGAIASVGAGMSIGFLTRTSIGRVDTDQLFLFFIALCLSFAMLAAREKKSYRMLGYALLTALSVKIAYWWHANGLYMVVVPAVMAGGVYLYHFSVKRASLALAAFVIAVNPSLFFATMLNFVPQVLSRLTGGIFTAQSISQDSTLVFPHTYTTVDEVERLGILEIFAGIAPHPLLGVVGALGFAVWMVLYPRKGIVFLPFFVLGLLSFVAGKRFIIFAAPFVWFGLAWMLLCSTRWSAFALSRDPPERSFFRDGAALATAALALYGVAAVSFDDYTPRPNFSPAMTRSFQALGQIVGDRGGIIVTWWDYGYYAHYMTGMDTFHDPGKQASPRTHLLARGLTSSDQDDLIQIAKFVTSQGTAGVEKNAGSLETLNSAIEDAGMPGKPLYLVLTYDFGVWMQNIAKLGLFDVEKGLTPSKALIDEYYTAQLKCRPISNTRLQCDSGVVDIEQGTLDNEPVFGEVVVIRDGFPVGSADKNTNSPLKLIIQQITSNNRSYFSIMHSLNWNNNFNQLFHQGLYDRSRFELVLDDYPVARVFRIIR